MNQPVNIFANIRGGGSPLAVGTISLTPLASPPAVPDFGASATCTQYVGNPDAAKFSGGSEQRLYWIFLLQPYVKNYQVFACPSNPNAFTPTSGPNPTCNAGGSAAGCQGTAYGGENSYGHNDTYLSPAGSYAGATGQPASIALAGIPRVASTIMICDASYYGAAFDPTGVSGTTVTSHCVTGTDCSMEQAFMNAQGGQYKYYWGNIGNAAWSYGGTTSTADASILPGKARHSEQIDCQFADGHAKALPWARVVGDVCLWTTDQEGAHPNCN